MFNEICIYEAKLAYTQRYAKTARRQSEKRTQAREK